MRVFDEVPAYPLRFVRISICNICQYTCHPINKCCNVYVYHILQNYYVFFKKYSVPIGSTLLGHFLHDPVPLCVTIYTRFRMEICHFHHIFLYRSYTHSPPILYTSSISPSPVAYIHNNTKRFLYRNLPFQPGKVDFLFALLFFCEMHICI